jgi:hypothetical protein
LASPKEPPSASMPPLQPDLPPSQAVPRNRWKICRESQGSGQDGGSGFVSLAHLPAEQSTFESCHPLTDLCWLTPQDLPASSWHCSLGKNREGVSNTPIERHGSNEQLGTAFTPIENHLTEISPVECTLPPLCASAGPSGFGRAPFHEETSCGNLSYADRTVLVPRSQKCKNIREKIIFERRIRV